MSYENFEKVYDLVPMMELSTLKLNRTLIKDTTKFFVCFWSWCLIKHIPTDYFIWNVVGKVSI